MWEDVTVTNLHDVDFKSHSEGVSADALKDIVVHRSGW